MKAVIKTFRIHTVWEMSRLAEELLAFLRRVPLHEAVELVVNFDVPR